MSEEIKVNPIEEYAAILEMQKTTGWKIFMKRYAQEPNTILTKLLDVDLAIIGNKYTIRDLYVFQLEAFGKIGKVLEDFKIDAQNQELKNKVPPQKGIG